MNILIIINSDEFSKNLINSLSHVDTYNIAAFCNKVSDIEYCKNNLINYSSSKINDYSTEIYGYSIDVIINCLTTLNQETINNIFNNITKNFKLSKDISLFNIFYSSINPRTTDISLCYKIEKGLNVYMQGIIPDYNKSFEKYSEFLNDFKVLINNSITTKTKSKFFYTRNL